MTDFFDLSDYEPSVKGPKIPKKLDLAEIGDWEQSEVDRQLAKAKVTKSGDLRVMSLRATYEDYKKDAENPVGRLEYKEILKFIWKRIWHYVIKERGRWRLPFNMGELFIKEAVFTQGYYIDWVKSKELGKRVKVYNHHSNGRKFIIKWDNTTSRGFNRRWYKFVPLRGEHILDPDYEGARGLSRWVKKCSEDPDVKDYRGHII